MNEKLPIKKIKPRRIKDEVYRQLKELILAGHLKPGDRLPPERRLAELLGVSRPVVREAISCLVAKGYLENRQGSGTYVRAITDEYIDNGPIADFLKRGPDALIHVVEVRKILETWSAYTAAQRATTEELAMIEEHLREFEEATKKGQLAHTADANFHLSIAYATHNPLLTHLMDSIYTMIEKVTYQIGLKTYRDPRTYSDLYRQHEAIFEAIKERNPEKAQLRMAEHMDYVERMIKSDLGLMPEAGVEPARASKPRGF